MSTINDNIALAEALWPNASWPRQLLDLWRERLSGLDQVILTEAIKTTKPKFASHQPELKWVLERYGDLYEQRNPTFGGPSRQACTSTFHVSWRKTSKHGVPGAWYGCRVQSRDEADSIAQQVGGRVTAIDIADDPYSEIETRQEVEMARGVIAGFARERIASILERLRRLGFCKGQLPSRIGEWPRMAVLAVYAEHLNQQERR